MKSSEIRYNFSAASLNDLINLTSENNISGVPVVDGDDLVGIITSRDIRFETRRDIQVKDVMTPKERLVTATEGADFSIIQSLLHEHRMKVLIVDEKFKLAGMITVKDIAKAEAFPMACKDALGQLRVGASVGLEATQMIGWPPLLRPGLISSSSILLTGTQGGVRSGKLDQAKVPGT